MTEPVAGLEVVLREHHATVQIRDNAPVQWRCAARDWTSDAPYGDGAQFAAHQADVIRAHLAATLAEDSLTQQIAAETSGLSPKCQATTLQATRITRGVIAARLGIEGGLTE